MTTLAVVAEAQEAVPLLAALQAGGYSSTVRRIGRLDVACLDTLLCVGAAGSLCEAAVWGDVIVGSCSIEHDYKLRSAFAARSADFRVISGPITSGDENVVDAARQRGDPG
jgi:nucleoside phosphorylase